MQNGLHKMQHCVNYVVYEERTHDINTSFHILVPSFRGLRKERLVDNLLYCFTFPLTQNTVSFETKSLTTRIHDKQNARANANILSGGTVLYCRCPNNFVPLSQNIAGCHLFFNSNIALIFWLETRARQQMLTTSDSLSPL